MDALVVRRERRRREGDERHEHRRSDGGRRQRVEGRIHESYGQQSGSGNRQERQDRGVGRNDGGRRNRKVAVKSKRRFLRRKLGKTWNRLKCGVLVALRMHG